MTDKTVEPTVEVKATAIVKIDETEKSYEGYGETLSKARYQAEKKARAYLRRHGLSIKMANVTKDRDEESQTSVFTVTDLDVPAPQIQDLKI